MVQHHGFQVVAEAMPYKEAALELDNTKGRKPVELCQQSTRCSRM